MRCVEATVSSVFAAFDEYMRPFTEYSHLWYTPMPQMMDIVRLSMATCPLISSSTAATMGTSYVARVSSSTPSIDAPSTSTVDPAPSSWPSSDVRSPEDH
ncbi:hypothetical protein M9H77_31732 [Catharanthus roseus]|uniref:Uncharacterized protein n=1 Tax=Catharanthus roseus TaxID=4058 RepID=A0ACC0A2R9_CATRO|nr:hypothetical protein M9H77_31732 [Catharanthus roseus]